jgi:hypothetical protein
MAVSRIFLFSQSGNEKIRSMSRWVRWVRYNMLKNLPEQKFAVKTLEVNYFFRRRMKEEKMACLRCLPGHWFCVSLLHPFFSTWCHHVTNDELIGALIASPLLMRRTICQISVGLRRGRGAVRSRLPGNGGQVSSVIPSVRRGGLPACWVPAQAS